MGEAEEPGPDEHAAAGEHRADQRRDQGEVQELHKRPVHQPGLVRVEEFLLPVLQDLIPALHETHTCVEGADGERRGERLVQHELLHHRSQRVTGEASLQEPHPEEIEVAVKAERDHGHVSRVRPVHLLFTREALVHEIPAREQAPVQGHIGRPREASDRR